MLEIFFPRLSHIRQQLATNARDIGQNIEEEWEWNFGFLTHIHRCALHLHHSISSGWLSPFNSIWLTCPSSINLAPSRSIKSPHSSVSFTYNETRARASMLKLRVKAHDDDAHWAIVNFPSINWCANRCDATEMWCGRWLTVREKKKMRNKTFRCVK